MVGNGEEENHVSTFDHPLTPHFSHRGVILRGEYGYFLRFQITQRFNNLIIPYNPNSWSEEQQEIHDLIKSLHNGGMGYRKIAKIWWSVNTTKANASVELVWDGDTNATAILLNGQGYWDLRTAGNEIINNATTPTGDVLLSTRDFVVGDNYTILVEFR